jgi:hypothetical protein
VPWTVDGGDASDLFGDDEMDDDIFTLDGDDVAPGTSHPSEWAKRRMIYKGPSGWKIVPRPKGM